MNGKLFKMLRHNTFVCLVCQLEKNGKKKFGKIVSDPLLYISVLRGDIARLRRCTAITTVCRVELLVNKTVR